MRNTSIGVNEPVEVLYKRVKENKYDNQYQAVEPIQMGCFLSDRVKVEAYQGYSKAYNLGEYLRLRGATSWKAGEQVTGLFKTDYPNVFFGDRVANNCKTLILFKYVDNKERLIILVFPDGFRPSRTEINRIIPTVF